METGVNSPSPGLPLFRGMGTYSLLGYAQGLGFPQEV